MKKEIRVFKTSTGWNVDMVGDKKIFQLFGSTVLPLPFTSESSSDTVVSDVKNRNPDAIVTLESR